MTPRERFIAALERRPVAGRVPHFELAFLLTMEAFGKLHPAHRNYGQWDQMEEKERQLHRLDMADVLIATAERFEHSAINLPIAAFQWDDLTEIRRLVEIVRERTGDRYALLLNLDATPGIPNGDQVYEFSMRLADEPEKVKAETDAEINRILGVAEVLAGFGGLDGFTMCCDYCMNAGPFLSPAQFGEFVAPFLAKQIKGFRDLGFYTIKHSDGNIMPILDQLAQCRPHALHSLDPQGGVDIAEVKRRYGHELCLVGNVNCGLMDTGTDEQVREAARYALKHGMPGGGYIFSTSNCVYTGMRLSRYELILDVWRQEGNYPGANGE
jgi:uroporphyrinogen decarboxylase